MNIEEQFPDPVSDERLDRLMASHAATTQGDWNYDGPYYWPRDVKDDPTGLITAGEGRTEVLLPALKNPLGEQDIQFAMYAHHEVPAIVSEVRRLKRGVEVLGTELQRDSSRIIEALRERGNLISRLEEQDRVIDETLGERDQREELLNTFAYKVAPMSVIGEHSSANDPWANALERLTPEAEVERLRAYANKWLNVQNAIEGAARACRMLDAEELIALANGEEA